VRRRELRVGEPPLRRQLADEVRVSRIRLLGRIPRFLPGPLHAEWLHQHVGSPTALERLGREAPVMASRLEGHYNPRTPTLRRERLCLVEYPVEFVRLT
jgi:hypothetical protein